MDIQQIIYSSRPVSSLSLADVDAIVTSAQHFNRPRRITGRLLVATAEEDRVLAFMQWIEGPTLAIRACMDRILKDPRHTSIQIVRDRLVEDRSYPDWSMRQEVLPVDQVESALAASGITGHVNAAGVLIVEGEIIEGDTSSQT